MEQARIERFLSLIPLLSGTTYYSSDRLHKKIGVTRRTVNRYLRTLRYTGITVEKIDGMGRSYRLQPTRVVQPLGEAWSIPSMDAYRMDGPERYHIRLQFSPLAMNLLQEKYSLADRYIVQEGDKYIFDSWVYALEGVGRFVMGLADETTILEGEELREYIRNYVSSHLGNI